MSKKLIAASAACALALGLTACSSGGSGTDTTAKGGDKAEGGTFTIWHYETEDSAMGQAWNKAIEIFKTEHPGVNVKVEPQVFEQIQKNAKIVLSGDTVPDVMEFNKGNATAGVLASEELITPFTDEATKRGWDKKLAASLQTTCKYDADGLMGKGDWYGIPNYGEYVQVYYNKDMFKKAGLEIPANLADFEKALDTFKGKGVTPLALAGAEYPGMQLWYQLVLANSDRSFIDKYQLFSGDADFHGPEMTAGTDKFVDWVKKGYVSKDSAGMKAEDAGVAFEKGTYPMFVSGSWWFGRFKTEITTFDWGQFLFPGNKLNTGSSGNLWVVPESAKNKELAYDFIDITLRPEVQNILGEKGGLPVAGDVNAITDPQTKEFTQNFEDILAADGLAYYPDWPVAGYYDVMVSGMQSLINQTKAPDQVLTEMQKPYDEGKKELLGK